ncbi:MAG: hypothetical protein J7K08_04960 [Thermoplasmata archaeon]|nr:hypothetical protein [Thermoplasmata archaeon]
MGRRYSLTAEERILFHLYDYVQYEDEFEVPPQVTQEGISKGAFIQRKHVPRSLKKLIEKGLVMERLSHVRGARQRLRVYFLTDEGRVEARKIIKSLSGKMVVVKEKGKTRSIPFMEYCFTHQVGKTPLQVLMEMEGKEEAAEASGEREIEEAKRISPGRESEDRRLDVYRNILKKAWEDGKLTRDEAELLKEARRELKVTEEEHRRLEEEVLKECTDGLSSERILDTVIKTALKDGRITSDEEAIIVSLLNVLGIPDKRREEILKSLPRGGKEKREKEKLSIYRTALQEALKDGHVSRDELALILMLKKTLGITEEEHVMLLKELGR